MSPTPRLLATSVVLILIVVAAALATPPGSATPHAESETINGKRISIEYSPLVAAKDGRPFGDLIQYGQVWSMGGAVLTTAAPLKFGDCSIAPGKYDLFAVPRETPPWDLIISKRVTASHTYNKAAELCRTKLSKSSSGLNSPPQKLNLLIVRISTQPVDLGFSLLVVQWVDTRVDVMFSIET